MVIFVFGGQLVQLRQLTEMLRLSIQFTAGAIIAFITSIQQIEQKNIECGIRCQSCVNNNNTLLKILINPCNKSVSKCRNIIWKYNKVILIVISEILSTYCQDKQDAQDQYTHYNQLIIGIYYRMTRNLEECFQPIKITDNMKLTKHRPTRQSQPLREQKFPEDHRRYNAPHTLYKKLYNKYPQTYQNQEINVVAPPSSNQDYANTSYVIQNQKQSYKHYKQPNQLNHKKFLSPKQQINNSILLIENILKKGIRPSVQQQYKSNENFIKRGSRYSQPLEEQFAKKQAKKQHFFKKGLENKNIISKTNLKDTMSSNNQRNYYLTKIQDFLYIKQLGRGKFGVVSLAIHKKSSFLYAIKAMSKKTIMSQNILDQIIREVKIQHFINHSNIVKLYDIFDDQEHLYLIMEYCNGGQFYRMLQKRGKIPQSEARSYVRQICNGVQQLHRHGIIHRDLKPQNIVLSFGMIKICDFGWSVASKNCLRSTFCGTPLYVSPQLLIGNDYNEKVDLWAIGIITYQMITGEIPFKINTQKQLVRIIDSNIVYPTFMSLQAKLFIKQLLDKNPISRATVSEVLEHKFLRNQSSQVLNQSKSIGNFKKNDK